jgi:hypothetical protein
MDFQRSPRTGGGHVRVLEGGHEDVAAPTSSPSVQSTPRKVHESEGVRMAAEKLGDHVSGVEFAVFFVAMQAGGPERILRRHHPMPNALCGGCLATPTVYPCQAARIAELARQCVKCGIALTVADIVLQLSRRLPMRT